MVIKTRKEQEIEIVGNGPFIMALTSEQIELIGAMMGMIRLGQTPYQQAALDIMDMLEDLTGDDEFTTYCLGEVMPILEVRDGVDFDVIATYDDDHIFEFVV